MPSPPSPRKSPGRLQRWISTRLLAADEIKVHGLLRTGTNYVQALLQLNFHVVCPDVTEGGWKHGPCRYDSRRKFVFLAKNPYAWLASFMEWERIHRRSAILDMSDFLAQPLTHGPLIDAWGFKDPLDAWNGCYRSWTALIDKPNVAFIRYEDLIRDFDATMRQLTDRLHLRMKHDAFVNIDARADTWETPEPRKEFHVENYREEKYMAAFNPAALAVIRERIDQSLLARFGYALR